MDLIKAQVMPEVVLDNSPVTMLSESQYKPFGGYNEANYFNAFSPSNPQVKSLNEQFQKTTLATVSQSEWTGPYAPLQYQATKQEFPVEIKALIAAGLLITILILGR